MRLHAPQRHTGSCVDDAREDESADTGETERSSCGGDGGSVAGGMGSCWWMYAVMAAAVVGVGQSPFPSSAPELFNGSIEARHSSSCCSGTSAKPPGAKPFEATVTLPRKCPAALAEAVAGGSNSNGTLIAFIKLKDGLTGVIANSGEQTVIGSQAIPLYLLATTAS
jgi:hypothetical protein